MSKTIVFCATEDAAERMRQALVNLNSDMVKENPDYVLRITGSDDYGKSKLKYFISTSQEGPVIATTSKLLSTGADCKMTKLIVLDEMIGSMTEFKQIIGRGTRLREKEGKTHFVVMDFRGVTRLFADPDWDGPIEIDPGFTPGGKKPPEGVDPNGDDPVDPPEPKGPKPIVARDGCKVQIIHKTVAIYDTNGKLLRQESIVDYTKENILGEYASLDNFIRQWTEEEKKEKIRELLLERGIDLEMMKADQGIPAMDRVYTTFKAYVQEKGLDTEDLLKELLSYAKWYEILLKGKTPDKQLNACIYRLNRLETTITRPFFLEVLRLQSESKLSWPEVRDVFLYTENYLFRRTMCDLPTNALNKIFLMLHREIVRFEGNDENYVEKFKYALLNKGDRGRFPDDEEFAKAVTERLVYKMNAKNKVYIFERLENHGTVEDKDIYHQM